MLPAAEPEVWAMFVSSRVKGSFGLSTEKSEYERMAAMSEPPMLQPVLRPK